MDIPNCCATHDRYTCSDKQKDSDQYPPEGTHHSSAVVNKQRELPQLEIDSTVALLAMTTNDDIK